MTRRKKTFAKAAKISLGYFVISGIIQVTIEGKIKWLSLVISSVLFGLLLLWAWNTDKLEDKS